MTEDETVGWHHRLKGHEFEKTLGDSEGQEVLQSMGSQRVRHNLVTEQQNPGCPELNSWHLGNNEKLP